MEWCKQCGHKAHTEHGCVFWTGEDAEYKCACRHRSEPNQLTAASQIVLAKEDADRWRMRAITAEALVQQAQRELDVTRDALVQSVKAGDLVRARLDAALASADANARNDMADAVRVAQSAGAPLTRWACSCMGCDASMIVSDLGLYPPRGWASNDVRGLTIVLCPLHNTAKNRGER